VKVLVIADIHGNAEALRAVLEKERDADRTVFLGDTVLSGPQANETMELLRGMPDGTHIQGNHDHELLDPSIFANWPATWLALNHWIIDHFDPAGYEFVRNLKPDGEYVEDGISMCLKHGILPGKVRNALPDTPDENLLALADGSACPYVLFGHSHVQFRREINGQQFINPGSVGQNRCGKQVACYGLFEDGAFRHCQVAYDQTPWLEAMDRVSSLDEHPDFRQWLKDCLTQGYGIGENEPWTRYAAEGYS
jgi:protein phosphatase